MRAARAASSISASVASRLGVAEVLAHGRVQQVGLLADHADDAGQVGEAQVAQVDAVDRDPPGGRGRRGGRPSEASVVLPEPVSPTSASVVPAGTTRSTSVERRCVAAGVGERRRPRSGRRRAPRAGSTGTGCAGSSTSTGRSRYSKMRANSASELTSETPMLSRRGQRPEEAALQRGERDEGADRQRAGAGQPGAEVDDGRDGGEDHAVDAMRQRPASCGAQLQVDQARGRAGEAGDQRGPGAQRAGELRAVDREALLDRDVEVGQLPLLRRGDLAAHPRDPARQPDRRAGARRARSARAARTARPSRPPWRPWWSGWPRSRSPCS